MGILNFLFKNKSQKEIQYPLNPELIRENRIVNALKRENETLKAQISELLAERRQEQENEIQEDKDELLRQKLKEDETEIKKTKFGRSASLRKFFADKKLLEKTEICDKDDNDVFGKFGDLLILDSGRLALTDVEGNVLSYGMDLNNVIYKPGTFINQLKRGRILIPYDKDYNPIVDWEEEEINDLKYSEEDKMYHETLKAKEKAKNLLIEKDQEIRRLTSELSKVENINIDVTKEYNELKRTVKLQEGQIDSSNSELSTIMEQFAQFQMSYGDIQRKVTSLTETKAIYEDIMNRQEAVIEKLLAQFEESGDKTEFRKAYAQVKEVIDYAKTRLPQQIILKEEQEEKTTEKLEEKR